MKRVTSPVVEYIAARIGESCWRTGACGPASRASHFWRLSASTPANGYAEQRVDGIELRDRVWLDLVIDDR